MTSTVIALYDDLDAGHQAVRALTETGVPNSSISLIAGDNAGAYASHLSAGQSGIDKHARAESGVAVGATVGGIGGLLLGLAALTVPGIGPVLAAGPLASVFTTMVGVGVGAVAGAAAGGLIGALADLGVPKDRAQLYSEGVRRSAVLVAATVTDSQVDKVRRLL